MLHSKFSGYRTVAMATDHTDAEGYVEITSWPTLDDCIIGAWDIASRSTWRSNQMVASLPVKWVIGQALIVSDYGRGIPYWRTIEVITLNYDGSRIVHSVSDKSGVSFDYDTPDDLLGPSPFDIWANENYIAPSVLIDPTTGQLESANQYLDRCSVVTPETEINTTMICADLGGLEQIPYAEPGVSHEIRNALIFKLGYYAAVAALAVIQWREGDNGVYSWIADLPNGASHIWADGAFVTPEPRVELTEGQVTELLIQLDHFTTISNDCADLDRCIDASLFALGIAKILG